MAQVVVYGPNGARTTANTELTDADKAKGYTKSEYERLLAGEIVGREGYENADKNYQSPEPLTPDYPGDYGGEDGSTPINERESVVGVGNTNYDNKDYSDVGPDGNVVVKTENGDVVSSVDSDGAPLGTIPRGAEFWNVDGNYYIVYFIPNSGVPIYYDTSIEDLKRIFVDDFAEVEQLIKTPTSAQWNKSIRFGNSLELADPTIYDPTQTPWLSFIDTIEKEAKIRPWLKDEEMVQLLAESTLEGRTVTDAEWQSTNWWRSHTQAQRDWLLLAQSDSFNFSSNLPADAISKIDNDKLLIKNIMEQSGIANPPKELVAWVGEKLTTGDWTEDFTADQIRILSDPTLEADLNSELNNFITSGNVDYDTTRAGESQVQRLVKEYLGPVFGGNLADATLKKYAGMIRNDPDAEVTIKEDLLKIKNNLFDEDNDITYEQKAAPWRGFTTNLWGGTVEETTSLFQEVLKLNDVAKATKLLYDEGLKDGGSDKIKNEVISSLVGSFGGGGVRRII
tara:strand:- start:859 stop:2385 length:1527 start_codon:yes stop_codon:yes gene_type:complete